MEWLLGSLVAIVFADIYIRFRRVSESLTDVLEISKKLFILLKLQNLIIDKAMLMTGTLHERSLKTVQREALVALKKELGDIEYGKLNEDIHLLGIDVDLEDMK